MERPLRSVNGRRVRPLLHDDPALDPPTSEEGDDLAVLQMSDHGKAWPPDLDLIISGSHSAERDISSTPSRLRPVEPSTMSVISPNEKPG